MGFALELFGTLGMRIALICQPGVAASWQPIDLLANAGCICRGISRRSSGELRRLASTAGLDGWLGLLCANGLLETVGEPIEHASRGGLNGGEGPQCRESSFLDEYRLPPPKRIR